MVVNMLWYHLGFFTFPFMKWCLVTELIHFLCLKPEAKGVITAVFLWLSILFTIFFVAPGYLCSVLQCYHNRYSEFGLGSAAFLLFCLVFAHENNLLEQACGREGFCSHFLLSLYSLVKKSCVSEHCWMQ